MADFAGLEAYDGQVCMGLKQVPAADDPHYSYMVDNVGGES